MTDKAARSERLIDNSRVLVTRWTLEPGTETGAHTHEMDYVVVPMTDGTLTITSDAGVTESVLRAGVPYAREQGVRHNVANRTADTIVFVEVEIR